MAHKPIRSRARLGSSAPPQPTAEEKLEKLNTAIQAITRDDVRTVVSCIPGHIEVGKVYELVLGANSEDDDKKPKKVQASLLHLALHHNAHHCAKLLLHLGANTEACESELGDRALHAAVRVGGYDLVSLLLEYGAVPDSLNSSQDTPLHLAAERGLVHSVRALLASGAPTNPKNRYNETPWEAAVLSGSPSANVCADLILTQHLQHKRRL